MKKTIWKFPFVTDDKIIINMPLGAEILHLDIQNSEPHIWALVDPESRIEQRHFEVFGTGHQIYYDMGVERKHIGTYFEGTLVWHLFERIN